MPNIHSGKNEIQYVSLRSTLSLLTGQEQVRWRVTIAYDLLDSQRLGACWNPSLGRVGFFAVGSKTIR